MEEAHRDSRARSTKTRIETAADESKNISLTHSRARSTKTRIETEVLFLELLFECHIREQDPLKQGLKHGVKVKTSKGEVFASKIH